MCVVCIYLIWIGIIKIIKCGLITLKNFSLAFLGLLSVLALTYLLTDLPAFITGGNELDIKITDMSGGRKSHIYIYTDERGNNYWSSGSGVDYGTWAYFKKNGLYKDKYSQIKYLPHTKMIMYINEDGREVYNFLSELGLFIVFGIIMVVFWGLKEVMKDAVSKT